MENVRAHLIISGYVQGVFFRAYTQEKAAMLGLKGWVKNNHDGTVEAVFEGERGGVEEMIRWCHKGPTGARVSNAMIEWGDYTGEFRDFSISYKYQ